MAEVWKEPRPNKAKRIFQEFPSLPTTKFDMKHFRIILVALSAVFAEWEGIGLCLKIAEHTMADLKGKWRKQNKRGLISIAHEWMKDGYKEERLYPCWKSVVYIVADSMGGNNPMAARIIAKNCEAYEKDQFFGFHMAEKADSTPLYTLRDKSQFVEDLYNDYLHEVKSAWFEMGVLLGVPFETLESIDEEHANFMNKLIEMIGAWIDLYYDPKVDYLPEPTLQILVGVVANVMGGNYRGLAKKIAGLPWKQQLMDQSDEVRVPSGDRSGSPARDSTPTPPPPVQEQEKAVPLVYPDGAHLEAFNGMLPTMKKSIVGSVDDLCLDAIARKLMTHPEKAGILEGDNKFPHASRFLEHFALKIEVEPPVLFQFTSMLKQLGTCDGSGLVKKLEETLKEKAR